MAPASDDLLRLVVDDQNQSLDSLLQSGFTRIITHGMTRRIDETLQQELELTRMIHATFWSLRTDSGLRLESKTDSQKQSISAFSSDSGTCHLLIEQDSTGSSEDHRNPTQSATSVVDSAVWIHQIINEGQSCSSCRNDSQLSSRDLFNFNSVHGACVQCSGTGTVLFDQKHRKKGRSDSTEARRSACPECRGTRLRLEADSCVVNELTFRETTALELRGLQNWLNDVRRGLTPLQQTRLQRVFEHLASRMQFLMTCGLEYLSLDRPLQSCPGESARESFSQRLWGPDSSIHCTFSTKPHQDCTKSDTQKIISVVRQLRDQGNTIVVVEHDPDFILAADEVIEIGPGAAMRGTRCLYGSRKDSLQPRQQQQPMHSVLSLSFNPRSKLLTKVQTPKSAKSDDLATRPQNGFVAVMSV